MLSSPADTWYDPNDLEEVSLNKDWKDLREEDEQYVRDCPEDTPYEVNRQRYRGALFPPPTTRKERLANFVQGSVQAVSSAASATTSDVSQVYAAEGTIGVARTGAQRAWTIVKGIWAYRRVSPPSAAGSNTNLQRTTGNGQNYALPSADAIRAGHQRAQGLGPELRDLAVSDDDISLLDLDEREEKASACGGGWPAILKSGL